MMSDKPYEGQSDPLKSGVMPRVEPRQRREPPRPNTLPEAAHEEGATTGVMSVVTEDEDINATRDDDDNDAEV